MISMLLELAESKFVKSRPYTIKKARIDGLFIFAYLVISQSITANEIPDFKSS